MVENIEYSDDWLTKEIIKTDFEQRKIGKKIIVRMEYMKLLQLFKKFIKMNKEGD